MLLNGALWAPGLARVLDTVAPLHRRQDDARNPVPAAADAISSYQAKSFVDVTVDRDREGARRAACCSCWSKPWGLHLDWQR